MHNKNIEKSFYRKSDFVRRHLPVIYLDYTANTPVEPQVLKALCEAERRLCGFSLTARGKQV